MIWLIRISALLIFSAMLLACGQTSHSDVVDSGMISPTIYYTPVFKSTDQTCSVSERKNLHNSAGESLIQICPKLVQSCDLQGTCFIEENGKLRRFNIIGRSNGQNHYHELGPNECSFGFGVRDICLDPFYTMAADLAIYRPGDVIQIPAVEGTLLPDGTKHSGYFIIRDQGAGIKGKGRFDIFTGFLSPYNNGNPFLKLKLGDKSTRLPFNQITGAMADKVKAVRHYPR
jgi:3D (Asp-Asp-Asp) domain-containing protein